MTEPFVALPGRRDLVVTGAMAVGFLAFFYAVYGLANYLTSLHTARLTVHMAWETSIPFVPAAALVYGSMNVLLLLGLFVLRTPAQLKPFLLTLAAETVLAGVCFVALPVEMVFEHDTPDGFFGAVFAFADAANLDHNELPSLHVAFSVTAALVLGRRAPRPAAVGLHVWALAISVSTLLIHAHYVIDIVAGAALGVAATRFLYDRWA